MSSRWDSIDLTPMFRAGMPIRRKDRLNQNFMYDLLEHRVMDTGLQPLDSALAFSADVDIPAASFPHPNLMMGETHTILASASKFFNMTFDGSVWQAVEITTGLTPAGTDVWHFADKGDHWLATNGVDMVFCKDGVYSSEYTKVPNTVCTFRGRVYAGGLGGNTSRANAEFWNTSYIALLEELIADIYPDATTSKFGQNAVFYSCVGGEDFFEHYAESPSLDKIVAYQRRRESGYSIMPWSGKVMMVKPLGDGVVVYGANGITFMLQALSPISMQLTNLPHEGVPSRRAVAGDRFRHVFIGNSGSLFEIGPDLKIKELGYEEVVADIGTLANTLINYDPIYQDIYLGIASKSRLITPNGMSRLNKSWTTMCRDRGKNRGFYITISSTPSSIATTGVITFPNNRLGTVHGLRLNTKDPSKHSVVFSVRPNEADGWKNLTAVTPDAGGFCDVLVSTYQVQVTVTTDTTVAAVPIEGATLFYDTKPRYGLKELL